MEWWLWMLLGIALLAGEMIIPGGLFMLFFGLGALVVGVLHLAHLAGPDWMQWLLFSVASIGMLLLLRSKFLAILNKSSTGAEVDSFVGQVAVASDAIAVGATGKAELRGSSWNAHNADKAVIQKGERCRVEKVDGLTLYLVRDK